jgi:sigma-B regulation protein RsbU (phosphoserine phosphatase)
VTDWQTVPIGIAMALPELPLTEVVRPAILQTLQDRFSALGRVSMCIVDSLGRMLTEPSWGHDFARLAAGSPRGREVYALRLRQMASKAYCTEPVTFGAGWRFYSAAIDYQHERVAVIVVGPRPDACLEPEVVRDLAVEYDLEPDALQQAANSVEPWSEDVQQATFRFADVLAETLGSLYHQGRAIRHQMADLNAVHDFAALLARTHDLDEILEVTARRVVETLQVRSSSIRLLDEETGELVIRAVHNLSDAYLSKGPVRPETSSVDAAAMAGETVYIADAPTDPRFQYPEEAHREGIVSGLCVPMAYGGKAVGVLHVYTGTPYAFDEAEVDLLRSLGSQAAGALTHARLFAEQAEAERVKRYLHHAGEIQRRMLPAKTPNHANVEFGCVYEPILEVGGDFYDFIALPEGNLGVCIADVVGKGLPAALMMASVRAALRSHAHWLFHLHQTVSYVNKHLNRDTLIGEFATLVYGVLGADGRRFTYCNAGHQPPIVLRGDRFIELEAGGMVIGVDPEAAYEWGVITLQPGDVMVMYTDGVNEATNFEDEMFRTDRLRESIRRYRHLAAPQIAQQLLWDVRRFIGLADPVDDITIVVLKAT